MILGYIVVGVFVGLLASAAGMIWLDMSVIGMCLTYTVFGSLGFLGAAGLFVLNGNDPTETSRHPREAPYDLVKHP